MNKRFFILCVLLVSLINLNSLTAPPDYTQWRLPQNAIARMGKGILQEVEYSPRGDYVAIVVNRGIWLYEAESFIPVTMITDKQDFVYQAVFSPDGETIAVVYQNTDVKIYSVPTGIEQKHLVREAKDDAFGTGKSAIIISLAY